MSKAVRAGELVLKAIQCHKAGQLREAVKHLDEAIACINYAIQYENYGSTGQHILHERLNQYKKYAEKLRAKLPPEENQPEKTQSQHASVPPEVGGSATYRAKEVKQEPEVTQTYAIVHDQGKQHVTALDEPDGGHVVTEDQHEAVRPCSELSGYTTQSDDQFHIIPVAPNQRHLQTAVDYTNQAAQTYQENRHTEALDLYNRAIEYYNLSIREEMLNEADKEKARRQVLYCQIRVGVIRRLIKTTNADGTSTEQHYPESTNPSEGLFRPIPGAADYKHLETAINFAKKASQADQENNLTEALDLYNKAIEFFYLSIQEELSSDVSKEHVRPQVTYCEVRAEVIKHVLKKDRSGYLTDDDLEGEQSSLTDRDDANITDQSTLQRRPPAKVEVIGLDIGRSTLLEAATGGPSFKSILLVGATGTGKTTLVRSLFKNTKGCTYLYQDAADLLDQDVDSQQCISDLFDEARKQKPSVIFFDKIDWLFPHGRLKADSSAHPQINKELQEQLTVADGQNEQIVFISATDCPWFIGTDIRDRFDKVVYTPLPNEEERLAIAKLNAAELLNNLSEEDFVEIAHKTKGFTGADIHSAMKAAMVSTIKELHQATHFKKVQFEDASQPVAWTPCLPNDPQAVAMLFSDSVHIYPPEVTLSHVIESLQEIRYSVTPSEEFRLRNWVLLSGKAPPEQIPLLQQGIEDGTEYHSIHYEEPATTDSKCSAEDVADAASTLAVSDMATCIDESSPCETSELQQSSNYDGSLMAPTLAVEAISDSKTTAEMSTQTEPTSSLPLDPPPEYSQTIEPETGPTSIEAFSQTDEEPFVTDNFSSSVPPEPYQMQTSSTEVSPKDSSLTESDLSSIQPVRECEVAANLSSDPSPTHSTPVKPQKEEAKPNPYSESLDVIDESHPQETERNEDSAASKVCPSPTAPEKAVTGENEDRDKADTSPKPVKEESQTTEVEEEDPNLAPTPSATSGDLITKEEPIKDPTVVLTPSTYSVEQPKDISEDVVEIQKDQQVQEEQPMQEKPVDVPHDMESADRVKKPDGGQVSEPKDDSPETNERPKPVEPPMIIQPSAIRNDRAEERQLTEPDGLPKKTLETQDIPEKGTPQNDIPATPAHEEISQEENPKRPTTEQTPVNEPLIFPQDKESRNEDLPKPVTEEVSVTEQAERLKNTEPSSTEKVTPERQDAQAPPVKNEMVQEEEKEEVSENEQGLDPSARKKVQNVAPAKNEDVAP